MGEAKRRGTFEARKAAAIRLSLEMVGIVGDPVELIDTPERQKPARAVVSQDRYAINPRSGKVIRNKAYAAAIAMGIIMAGGVIDGR